MQIIFLVTFPPDEKHPQCWHVLFIPYCANSSFPSVRFTDSNNHCSRFRSSSTLSELSQQPLHLDFRNPCHSCVSMPKPSTHSHSGTEESCPRQMCAQALAWGWQKSAPDAVRLLFEGPTTSCASMSCPCATMRFRFLLCLSGLGRAMVFLYAICLVASPRVKLPLSPSSPCSHTQTIFIFAALCMTSFYNSCMLMKSLSRLSLSGKNDMDTKQPFDKRFASR